MRNGNGTFGKGNKGKPKGATSQKTKQWDELGLMHEEGGAETAQKILKAYGEKAIKENGDINPEFADRYMDHYKNLLEYFKPKQARVENIVTADVSVTGIKFEDAKDSKD